MKLLTRLLKSPRKISYSQCGEDLIVAFLLYGHLGLTKPTYLDIGAHHPVILSNTFLFYQNGSSGVCVEADPLLYAKIKRRRKRDTCLNVGVGASDAKSANFYLMSTKALSTFSEVESQRYSQYQTHTIQQVIEVPLVTINNVIEQYFDPFPNFVSLDTEGLDLAIIKSLDFERYRPQVFCIETVTYTEDKSEEKIQDIITYMKANNYMVYADTYINTIFVEQDSWLARKA
ncbi:MAG TPA: FkbM family methyltransferase [Blastocatellia bacterium]|nr:FkbM family methyltransferase [Blastocatellia bacterium]